MALGAVPYKAVATGTGTDANGVPFADVQIKDNNNVVKGTARIAMDDRRSVTDVIQQAIEAQMVADGGKLAAGQALLNAIRVGA